MGARHLYVDALWLRVTLYFARNPDEELTTFDVADKFETNPRHVTALLRRAVDDGVLRKSGTCGRGNVSTYQAGPNLLRHIGHRVHFVDFAATGNVRAEA